MAQFAFQLLRVGQDWTTGRGLYHVDVLWSLRIRSDISWYLHVLHLNLGVPSVWPKSSQQKHTGESLVVFYKR